MQLEQVNDTEYKLLSKVTVSTQKYLITVKPNIVFDGASIPKIFWSLIGSPFTGKYTCAALIHDALYMSESLKRKDCDDVFLELMKQHKVSKWKRYSMYWAVRVGGKFVWKKHNQVKVNINKGYVDVEVL